MRVFGVVHRNLLKQICKTQLLRRGNEGLALRFVYLVNRSDNGMV